MKRRSDFIPASKRCEQCQRVFTREDKPGVIYGAFISLRYCSPKCAADALRVDPAENFWSKVQKYAGCWMWQGRTDRAGYGLHWAYKRHHLAHRFSYALHNGAIPPGAVVMHTCDMPRCVNPAHLQLGTQRENIADMDKKRRRGSAKGERHGMASLNADQVRAIKADNRSARAIAASGDFPIGKSGIDAIRAGRTWRHL